MENKSLDVLRQVAAGQMTVEAADHALIQWEAVSPQVEFASAEEDSAYPAEEPASATGCWKNAWLAPVLAGTVFLALSGLLMNWAFVNQRSFWFACAWVPLIMSILVLMIGIWSRGAHWAHVRVHDDKGTNIVLGMPIPFRLAGWVLRLVGQFIPKYRENRLDFLPDVFEAMAKSREGMSVEVDEENGSRVRVLIT